jgi:uncharacterized surface protein with fasciclin (FAS1) repeats
VIFLCIIAAYAQVCPGATQSIPEIATTNEDFSTLVAAVQAAGLLDAVSGDGPIDVFAPTNAAFEKLLGALNATAEELLAQTDLLKRVVSYHVVVDGASCDSPLDGVVPTALAGNTLSVADSVVTDGTGNEIPILDTVPATNGQIFVIDQVLLPAEDKAAAPVTEPVMDDDMDMGKNWMHPWKAFHHFLQNMD